MTTWGQVSRMAKDKLEEDDDWESVYRRKDLEALLSRLLLHSCDPKSNEHPALSVIDARLKLLTYKQGRNQSACDYYK